MSCYTVSTVNMIWDTHFVSAMLCFPVFLVGATSLCYSTIFYTRLATYHAENKKTKWKKNRGIQHTCGSCMCMLQCQKVRWWLLEACNGRMGCGTKYKSRVWMIYVSHHAASGGQVSFVNLQTLGMLLYMLPSANSWWYCTKHSLN